MHFFTLKKHIHIFQPHCIPLLKRHTADFKAKNVDMIFKLLFLFVTILQSQNCII